ncbi:sulfatase [Anaerovibrio sp. JC8]|nr:sulfatase [Anaerovibrio sp. JC8]
MLHDYMAPGVGSPDIWLAVFGGTRLSIQTAGIITLVVGLPAVLVGIISTRAARVVFKVMNALASAVTAILFFASIPYYHQFHSRFHQILFNTANDDVYALFVSLVQEFNLHLRLAGALLVAALIWWLLNKFFGASAYREAGHKGKAGQLRQIWGHGRENPCAGSFVSGVPSGVFRGQPQLGKFRQLGKCRHYQGLLFE